MGVKDHDTLKKRILTAMIGENLETTRYGSYDACGWFQNLGGTEDGHESLGSSGKFIGELTSSM